MEFLKRKRVHRLLPFGVAAACLWGLYHFLTIDDRSYFSDHSVPDPYLHRDPGPPTPPYHPFREGLYQRPPPRPYLSQDSQYSDGDSPSNSQNLPHPPESAKWLQRADAVRNAFSHAYSGYIKFAGENDELLPLSNGSVNNFNGWRLTMVDSLDTMLIMGLYDDFHHAVPILANMTFALDEGSFAPFFETVIRYLGGLLSAYALSGEPILLSRADDLGSMLLPAFDTPHGLPMYAVNTVSGKTRQGWTGGDVLWSEALSCQMEYKYLAHLTGRKQYFDKVDKVMQLMYDAKPAGDMFPTRWSMLSGKPSNQQFSVGAFADSAHEYLLKQYLLTGRSETKILDLYLRDVAAILRNLVYVSPKRGLLYVTDTFGSSPSHTFEHLSCFLPGLLALGTRTLPLSPRDQELHEWAARGLAYTCYITYADSETGLGPDEVLVDRGSRWLDLVEEWEKNGKEGGVPPGLAEAPSVKGTGEGKDYGVKKGDYHLRPETVESLYYLWRTTEEEVWRDRGWEIFQAIENQTKTDSGYASLGSVTTLPPNRRDEMPSFFTAETLKYLYLLFADSEELVQMDKYVFNTEAHPLPVFMWSDWEKQRYGIPNKSEV